MMVVRHEQAVDDIKIRKETRWCIVFFLHVLEANCIMFWEFLVGNLDETQCWTPILTLGNWSLATWKESCPKFETKKKTACQCTGIGYCKQRPVNSAELGCFSIHKGFLYIFLFQDFEPNGLPPQKSCSNRRALGIEGWGTKFSGGKLRAKTGGIGIEYLDLFSWWFCTDSTMAQHYSTTIWGNSVFFFPKLFFQQIQDKMEVTWSLKSDNITISPALVLIIWYFHCGLPWLLSFCLVIVMNVLRWKSQNNCFFWSKYCVNFYLAKFAQLERRKDVQPFFQVEIFQFNNNLEWFFADGNFHVQIWCIRWSTRNLQALKLGDDGWILSDLGAWRVLSANVEMHS